MNLSLIEQLEKKGIKFSVIDNGLTIDAPKGLIQPDEIEILKLNKSKIIQLIKERNKPAASMNFYKISFVKMFRRLDEFWPADMDPDFEWQDRLSEMALKCERKAFLKSIEAYIDHERQRVKEHLDQEAERTVEMPADFPFKNCQANIRKLILPLWRQWDYKAKQRFVRQVKNVMRLTQYDETNAVAKAYEFWKQNDRSDHNQ